MSNPERWAQLAAQEHKENIKAIKGWLAVMTVATLAGFLIGYLAQ